MTALETRAALRSPSPCAMGSESQNQEKDTLACLITEAKWEADGGWERSDTGSILCIENESSCHGSKLTPQTNPDVYH